LACSSLVPAPATADTIFTFVAMIGNRRGEAGANGKGVLCWLGARQAAKLAPFAEAVSLHLHAVLACGGTALRARCRDVNGRGEAFVVPALAKLPRDPCSLLQH